MISQLLRISSGKSFIFINSESSGDDYMPNDTIDTDLFYLSHSEMTVLLSRDPSLIIVVADAKEMSSIALNQKGQ